MGSRGGTQDARLVWQTVHPPNCLAGHECLDFFTYPQVPILMDVKWHCGFDFQGPNNSKLCIFSCCALASYKFSLKKYLFRIFAHLGNGVIRLSTVLLL